MADITAHKVKTGKSGALKDTGYLDRLVTHRGPDARILAHPRILINGKISPGVQIDLTQSMRAHVVPNFYADLYKRIFVIPHLVNLGSISTEQHFSVQVWNANRTAVKLLSVTSNGGEGIRLSGVSAGTFNALALKKWDITVGMNGPAVIDCTVTFKFLGHNPVTLKITGSRSTDWQFFPDWSESVTENLEWLTSVHQSITGAEQRVARRLSPRRTFEFKVTMTDVERQYFESALYVYGARVWAIPVFPDCAYLLADTKQGQHQINIDTTGYDFVSGGRVILMSGKYKEMAEIVDVQSDKLIVKRPIVSNFDRTLTRVYPLRSAVLTDMPQITRLSDGVCRAQVRLKIHEHNHYANDVAHLPTYRNHRVLEPTSDWSEDVTAQYTRLIKSLDNETGLPHYLDTAQKAFQVTSHRFIAQGREQQRKLRQLFYYLNGRQKTIWIATASTDLTPAAALVGKNLDIAFINYTAILQSQTGRQDIRIECADGRIFYRRIVSSSVVDSQTERLALDGDTLNLKQDEIAKISFLTLSRLDSDTVSWVHHTDADGVATITVSFRGVRDELEI
ncbi:hypothetical protein [Aggregatibacter actinomycetemcomitans]|uniref:hypothetical protein n=1 Tax=Aggregatibacter actinomycetemcomitans TaxID=714 RepID=UPI00023FFF33|nr:hypothetical protein [Aggregatibacter actinomycetemcomitans]EHK90597.1 hypothetical protein RHAA1_05323 [Aggregatibacter actinomycetemcomitans RhAA1]KNE77647.1 phage tail protein [Aggregatibacter actinomycetemcomitans RhAA1]MBN6076920.1 phage tail protein [Aggregatibacter actinomycetemcomitans]MBN6077242.1 phage tail protein [Aggregatibacter actinomycetemcomitans]MBN6077366.1 phage tail protein [Aggregatibacter actinomycetemcomitans]